MVSDSLALSARVALMAIGEVTRTGSTELIASL
jgi:hypothetical protein